MNAKTKSIAIIIGTLALGVVIGALSTGAIMNNRLEALQALRMQGGLPRQLERIIDPIDDAQRAEIRAILQRAARRQIELRRTVLEQHRALFEDVRSELDAVLTADQKARLRAWIEADRRAGRMPPVYMPRRGEDGRNPGPSPRERMMDSLQGDSMKGQMPGGFRRRGRLRNAPIDSAGARP